MKSTLKSHVHPAPPCADSQQPAEAGLQIDAGGTDRRACPCGGLTKKTDLRSWITKRLLLIYGLTVAAAVGVAAGGLFVRGGLSSEGKTTYLLAAVMAQTTLLLRPIIRSLFPTRASVGGRSGNSYPPRGIKDDATEPRLRAVKPQEVPHETDN
jgi:hypothetical protein